MARLDLFISYTGSDHAWAEWIAWQLKAAGYSVFLQAWHFRPGKNFILEMEEGMAKCDRTLIVLSPRYFTSGFTKAEWTAAFAKDPTGEKGLFIPVRIEKCDLPDLLAARIYIDLVGLDEDTTRRALIDGLRPTGEPTSEPHFPGSRPGGPAFPPTLPAVIHNLPFGSNPHFSGRSAEIKELHELLWSEPAFAELRVVAIHGLGGVGKTELALQFAWQAIHERAYGAVFWLKADSHEALDDDIAALAPLLRIAVEEATPQAAQCRGVLDWLATHDCWLVVADNADNDNAVRAIFDRFVPRFRGHLIITSCIGHWPPQTRTLPLNHLATEAAVEFLLRRIPGAEPDENARALAEALQGLPLALEQAAAFMRKLGGTFAEYLALFRKDRGAMLAEHQIDGNHYKQTVATTLRLAADKLTPLARTLLRLAAWLGPDAIPRQVFLAAPDVLAQALRLKTPPTELAMDQAIMELGHFSMIRVAPGVFSIHRLVQAVEQESIPRPDWPRWIAWCIRLMLEHAPDFPTDARQWPKWQALRPHVESLLDHAMKPQIVEAPVALLANQFGLFLNACGELAQAEAYLRASLEFFERTRGYRVEAATVHHNLGCLLRDMRRLPEAEKKCRRAVEIGKKELNKNDPTLAHWKNSLGGILISQGKYKEAEPLCLDALKIGEATLGEDHPDVAAWHIDVARVLWAEGQKDKAESHFRRAIKIGEAELGPDHPEVAVWRNHLGKLLLELWRFKEARTLILLTLTVLRKALPPEHPDILVAQENLASIEKELPRQEES